MNIIPAEPEDLQEILALQRLAYQSEAQLVGTDDIPPLRQTLAGLRREMRAGVILKAVEDGRIIGSVRGQVRGNTLYIGRLFVHPDRQRGGIGTRLLSEMERICPHRRCELFTSTRSEDNLRFYEKRGYRRFRTQEISDDLTLIYLEKP